MGRAADLRDCDAAHGVCAALARPVDLGGGDRRGEGGFLQPELGASDDDVKLGAAATVTIVRSTPLELYRVIDFATHGLVAGEVGGLSEPALVLSLPTVGPLLLTSLVAQDMFLAGTIVLMLGVMTVIGTFVSDLVLMWIDPRIRFQVEE